jgi:hypothetical protein
MSLERAIKIVQEAVEAHGGLGYWNSLKGLEAEITAKGFLFTAKRRPVLNRVRMRAHKGEPYFAFFDFPQPGQTAELIGTNEVRLLDGRRSIIARRENPRAAFHGIKHFFYWDDLDFTYFAGYATWNYLTTPFLLLEPGFILTELDPLPGALAALTRIEVIFPDHIPTHSRKQTFYFDDQRLLRRLDYTAEVVGGWAHAAHLCEEYRTFGGIKVPTKRWALPLLFGNTPLSGPKLVDLEVHRIQPIHKLETA